VKARRLLSLAAVTVGAVLALGLLLLAEPANVVALARRLTWRGMAVSFAWSCMVLACRGARLSLLSGGRLTRTDGSAAIAVGQFAGAALPMRLGDVVLFMVLQSAGLPGAVRGASFVVLLRALDVAAVLTWAAVVGVWLGASGVVAAAGLTVVALLIVLVAARLLRLPLQVVRRLRHRRGWLRRALGQALRVRHELRLVARSPLRVAAVVALSLLAWGGIWASTVAMLHGMGLHWPVRSVLLGVVGATLGAAVPINAVGNFGTLEAGWTAALVSVGVAPADALTAGFATHVWSLAFSFALFCAGAGWLAARGRLVRGGGVWGLARWRAARAAASDAASSTTPAARPPR
jgi:hypothetical protein